MDTYALLTRLGDEAAQTPTGDYLDIFTAPDQETALKVATLVRVYGHARTEVFGATEWPRYKELINQLEPDVVEATHL